MKFSLNSTSHFSPRISAISVFYGRFLPLKCDYILNLTILLDNDAIQVWWVQPSNFSWRQFEYRARVLTNYLLMRELRPESKTLKWKSNTETDGYCGHRQIIHVCVTSKSDFVVASSVCSVELSPSTVVSAASKTLA